MVRRIRKRVCGLITLKRPVYLISPNKINQNFYTSLDKVLSFKNVNFFQLRLKHVSQKKLINICKKIILIDNFYKKKLNKKPKIAVLGLNPHCESVHKLNEDEKIIKPATETLFKKGFDISGPYSADTFFIKKNRKKTEIEQT